jgi:hypothetical protein
MVITVQQIIKCALQDIGAIAKQEAPGADEIADGLLKLNVMIDAWSVRSLVVLGTVLEGFALTGGKRAYTIGEAGDFATDKPSRVTDAFVRDSAGTDTPLEIITQGEYDRLPDKTVSTGRPLALCFDPGPAQAAVPAGVVSLYPAPDASTQYTLYLGEQKPLTEFHRPTDAVTFQPAYYEALEYNLALRLWRQYHEDARPIPADIVTLARDSLKVIETMSSRTPTARIEAPGGRGRYSVLTGGAS